MDELLYQKFATLRDENPSPSLHKKIMRRVFIERYKTPLITVGALVVLNLMASGWFAVTRLIENDVQNLLVLAIQDFEFNLSYITDFATIIGESLPVGALGLFLPNLLLGVGGLYFVRHVGETIKGRATY